MWSLKEIIRLIMSFGRLFILFERLQQARAAAAFALSLAPPATKEKERLELEEYKKKTQESMEDREKARIHELQKLTMINAENAKDKAQQREHESNMEGIKIQNDSEERGTQQRLAAQQREHEENMEWIKFLNDSEKRRTQERIEVYNKSTKIESGGWFFPRVTKYEFNEPALDAIDRRFSHIN